MLIDCPICHGSGELHHLEAPPDPQTDVASQCWRCGGDGVIELDAAIATLIWHEHQADVLTERHLNPPL
jgi:hypothetical protein